MTGFLSGTMSLRELNHLSLCFICNTLGCFITSKLLCFAKPELCEYAASIFKLKLDAAPPQTIILGIMCGALMAIAVEIYTHNKGISKYIGIMLCIPTFILCEFEHSIADLGYYFMSNTPLDIYVACFFYFVVWGNAVGGMLMRYLID